MFSQYFHGISKAPANKSNIETFLFIFNHNELTHFELHISGSLQTSDDHCQRPSITSHMIIPNLGKYSTELRIPTQCTLFEYQHRLHSPFFFYKMAMFIRLIQLPSKHLNFLALRYASSVVCNLDGRKCHQYSFGKGPISRNRRLQNCRFVPKENYKFTAPWFSKYLVSAFLFPNCISCSF